jgi:hypothetical protein
VRSQHLTASAIAQQKYLTHKDANLMFLQPSTEIWSYLSVKPLFHQCGERFLLLLERCLATELKGSTMTKTGGYDLETINSETNFPQKYCHIPILSSHSHQNSAPFLVPPITAVCPVPTVP